MKRHYIKYNLKEVLTIIFLWLLVIVILYVTYLKIKLLNH